MIGCKKGAKLQETKFQEAKLQGDKVPKGAKLQNIHKTRKIVESDRLREILESIEVGMNITDACELSGICRETFYNWKRADPNAERLLRETALKAKKRNIGLINKHATEGDWKAAAWWLERKYQEEFSLRCHKDKDNQEVLDKLDLVLKAMNEESKREEKGAKLQ